MLTLFTIPKAFRGHFKVIQTNAIRSWTLLQPKPEIILLGDDEGTAEIASELCLRHIPEVERNEYGTPLVSSVFYKAQELSSNSLMCYVNADIILMNDFMEAVKKVIHLLGENEFLVIGRKSNVEINELLDFEQPEWESKLRNLVKADGKYVTPDSDYFVFPKGLYTDIPPFAIGRCFWSPWLVYDVRRRRIPVIDTTPIITAVESRHDYSHATSTGGAKRLSGVEYVRNRSLFKGCKYFTTVDATHMFTHLGLKKSPFRNRIVSLWVRSEYYVYFLLKGRLYPYSLPLIILYRWAKSFFTAVSSISHLFRLYK